MQLKKTSAFTLYIGSYLPLGLVLLVQDIDLAVMKGSLCLPGEWSASACRLPLQHPWWSLCTVGLGMACFLITLWTLRNVATPSRIRIIESKHIPADLINYAMPYIVSFMGIDFSAPDKLMGFCVFFIWIFWIIPTRRGSDSRCDMGDSAGSVAVIPLSRILSVGGGDVRGNQDYP